MLVHGPTVYPRYMLKWRRRGLGLVVVLFVAGCSSGICETAASCTEAVGTWEGNYRVTEGDFAGFTGAWEVTVADDCSIVGTMRFGLSTVPVEGAMCDASNGEVVFQSDLVDGSAALSFSGDAVSGPFDAQVKPNDSLYEPGRYVGELNGTRTGGPSPCDGVTCDDGDPCTDDTCDAGECVTAPNTASCDDGNACTDGDRCSAGSCAGGGPTVCDDGNACTDDSCDASAGCIAAPNTAMCDDGNLCTDNDQCTAAMCMGAAILGCVIVCGNSICEPGEDCMSCGPDCAGQSSGPPSSRHCCGDGLLEPAEGDGSICDGNP